LSASFIFFSSASAWADEGDGDLVRRFGHSRQAWVGGLGLLGGLLGRFFRSLFGVFLRCLSSGLLRGLFGGLLFVLGRLAAGQQRRPLDAVAALDEAGADVGRLVAGLAGRWPGRGKCRGFGRTRRGRRRGRLAGRG
jgi:hypothetical protein